MARRLNILTAIAVRNAAKPGLTADGGGLYLQIGPTGGKSWLFRFMLKGKARAMGLGPLHTVSLAEARQAALECRKALLEGKDPIEERKSRIEASVPDAQPTFEWCATAYIKAHAPGWRNKKHAEQWQATLKTYAQPVFGERPVDQVDLGAVMRVLEPIWSTKTETASRVRGRVEAILDWAAVRGFRSGDNPARWRGHLDALLPARTRVRKVEHHAALPYAELSDFVSALRDRPAVSAKALEFLILTAARTGEVIRADWSEIDLEKRIWTIPAERMKASREHRVPLSKRATAILSALPKPRTGIVFNAEQSKSPLSNAALLALLKRMERADLTAHGFRSTFRDWVAEKTTYPNEMAEMALAHTVSDRVEAAYRRGDMFERRKKMMEDWAAFCGKGVQRHEDRRQSESKK
ncbi:MAG: integrase arm-type DNA-binding domain-containing protein [Bosea sp. (in: a-proteobacteria)]|uniref:tyrosine-type recombinase/integrase n=1 Tax=Bosea sp. (in: a-proteobacteria) TaxID=1871050 RepID=UPI0027350C0E|nr:site-specific integrase [Bosea sp. (in: a-proteobacteria)]MDP3603828.1 integrase arm-type DNA-binding domain-containing protein [Bosea sp. (in: a-proteobacteria)]